MPNEHFRCVQVGCVKLCQVGPRGGTKFTSYRVCAIYMAHILLQTQKALFQNIEQ